MNTRNQQKKQSSLLNSPKPNNTKYKKFLGNKSSGTLLKRQFSVGNMSILKGHTNKSVLSQHSHNSKHIIRNKPKGSSSQADSNMNHTHFLNMKKKQQKNSVKSILNEVSLLLDQFRNLVRFIEREIQRSVDNVVRKLQKDIFMFLQNKQFLEEKERNFNLKKKTVSDGRQEGKFAINQGNTNKFPVLRMESMTTEAQKYEKDHMNQGKYSNHGYHGEKKNHSTFSNLIKLRQDLKKGAVCQINKKISLKEEEQDEHEDHEEEEQIIMMNSNENIDDYRPSEKSSSRLYQRTQPRKFQRKLYREQSSSRYDQVNSFRGDLCSEKSSPSRLSRRTHGDRSASKQVQKLRGRLNNLKKVLEDN